MPFPFRRSTKLLKRIAIVLLVLSITWMAIRTKIKDGSESSWPSELIHKNHKQLEKDNRDNENKWKSLVLSGLKTGIREAKGRYTDMFASKRLSNLESTGLKNENVELVGASPSPMEANGEGVSTVTASLNGKKHFTEAVNEVIGHNNRLKEAHIVEGTSYLPPCMNVHAFYYPWYSSPKIDGHYSHWNHRILPHWDKEIDKLYKKYSHQPPNDIASDFYPELGAYSSRDPQVLQEHFKQIVDARIGVIVVSYYPAGTADENGKPWDDLYSLLLDKAAENGVKVTFHIEPYKGRNEKSVRDDIVHIIDSYGSHKGFYRYNINNYRWVPLFYVYDSYLTKQESWAKILKADGPDTIRGTKYDSVMIGLLVDMPHSSYTTVGGFDGMYSYFAANGFTYGSRWENWREISVRSTDTKSLFIPSVGPGYIDTNIRPWNSENTRDRSSGGYYKDSWRHALEVKPKIISITSFNEWHEGTQIEKAISKSTNLRSYLDYKPFSPDYYLKLTRSFVHEFKECNI